MKAWQRGKWFYWWQHICGLALQREDKDDANFPQLPQWAGTGFFWTLYLFFRETPSECIMEVNCGKQKYCSGLDFLSHSGYFIKYIQLAADQTPFTAAHLWHGLMGFVLWNVALHLLYSCFYQRWKYWVCTSHSFIILLDMRWLYHFSYFYPYLLAYLSPLSRVFLKIYY